jgi:hypothetical protein
VVRLPARLPTTDSGSACVDSENGPERAVAEYRSRERNEAYEADKAGRPVKEDQKREQSQADYHPDGAVDTTDISRRFRSLPSYILVVVGAPCAPSADRIFRRASSAVSAAQTTRMARLSIAQTPA